MTSETVTNIFDRYGTQSVGIPPFILARDELYRDKKDLDKRRANAVVCGLELVLHHHGCPESVLDDFRSQVMKFLIRSDERLFFKCAKFLVCLPFALYLKNAPPKAPEEFAFTGIFKKWMKSRFVVNKQNTHLWYSFLQTKRSALPLTNDLVLKSYQEHREAMLVDDPSSPEDVEIVMQELDPILRKLGRQIRPDFESEAYFDEEDFKYRSPDVLKERYSFTASSSACYEASRRDGGAQGHLARRAFRENPRFLTWNSRPGTYDGGIRASDFEFCGMDYRPIAYYKGQIRFNLLVNRYELTDGLQIWKTYLDRSVQAEYYGNRRSLKCTIQAVLEPLKVRVISKGEAVPYYHSKILQKRLHSALRKMDCFRLIGEPIRPDHLDDIADHRLDESLTDWVSVDYSAATDKLSALLSRRILETILEYAGVRPEDPDHALYLSVLAPHWCEYPSVRTRQGNVQVPPVQQRNGQLMGSILSFNILCLANLGVYLRLTNDTGRSLYERLRSVLVNGDDMIYVGSKNVFERHIDLSLRYGLEMSVGKAYCHPVVANANSTCFLRDLRKSDEKSVLVKYLNTGLFFGQGKVLGRVNDCGGEETGRKKFAVINELLAGCRDSRRKEILGWYIQMHRADLARECRAKAGSASLVRNLFLPESVGGMGCIPPDTWKFHVTTEQRRLARSIYDSDNSLWSPLDSELWESRYGSEIGVSSSEVEYDDSVRIPWLSEEAKEDVVFPPLSDQFCSVKRCREGFFSLTRPRSLCEDSVVDPVRELERRERCNYFEREYISSLDEIVAEMEVIRKDSSSLASRCRQVLLSQCHKDSFVPAQFDPQGYTEAALSFGFYPSEVEKARSDIFRHKWSDPDLKRRAAEMLDRLEPAVERRRCEINTALLFNRRHPRVKYETIYSPEDFLSPDVYDPKKFFDGIFTKVAPSLRRRWLDERESLETGLERVPAGLIRGIQDVPHHQLPPRFWEGLW